MLGVLGGSGLYSVGGLKLLEEVKVNTPFGEPSSEILIYEHNNKRFAFLPRHGREHDIPPHLVPYRANLWAFKEVGVSRVLGIYAVGGIDRSLKPGEFFFIEDFLNFTRREDTFYEGRFSKRVRGEDEVCELINSKKVVHLDVSRVYCEEMLGLAKRILDSKKLKYEVGVYACTQGPRFESKAEIRMLETLGAQVVGMTAYPEIVLARELGMCYLGVCVVTNPAAGIANYKLTSEEVITLMRSKNEEITHFLLELLKALPEKLSCDCKGVLKGAQV